VADTQPRMLGAPSVLHMRRELLHRAMQVRAFLQRGQLRHVKERCGAGADWRVTCAAFPHQGLALLGR
jgi:hypothetical protein